MGRLLIAFILHHDVILSRPLLYLSLYFKRHREAYYRLLDRVRSEGDWEAWVDFFLESVRRTAGNAVDTARRLVALFERDERNIQALGRSASTALRVFQAFQERPLLTLRRICERTGLSFPAAGKAVERLERLGIVREITGRRRGRVFAYDQYVGILNEGTEG
jgi:Fic family protein